MADVNIKIDIDADTSAIDRVRRKLIDLCREVDDCTDTMDKHTKSLRDLSNAQDDAGRGAGRNGRNYNTSGKAAKKLTSMLGSLAKFGFKVMAIEAAAALAVIGSAAILFKSGQFLAKGYQAALSGVAYAMTAIVAAGAAALAAMRQFQAVQAKPGFMAGTANTEDPMKAASSSMKMFIDDQQMAVLGTKGLTSAFKTLNDQQQITGRTTAVFRELSNYTAGMGGDMEKGSQAMAKFLAQFQKDKTMTEAVKTAGKELGPGFEKILKEANKLGLTTYEKFSEAALKGELGDTFKNYAGQLNALNSTVIGRFKQGFASIKNLLVEVGEPLLGPITKQIPRVVRIVESLILRIRSNVNEIGSGSLLEGLVNGLEKVALWIGKLVTHDLKQAGEGLNGLVRGWQGIVRLFEKLQDYLRPLVPAGEVLGRILGDLFGALGGKFNNTIQNLSDNLVNNEDKFRAFTAGFSEFMVGFSAISKVITDIFIALLPGLGKALALAGQVLEILAKILSPLDEIVKIIMGLAAGLDAVFNPIFGFIEKITFGVVGLKNVIQGLTAAVIAFAAAMTFSSGARGIGKKILGMGDEAADLAADATGGKKGKIGKALRRGGKSAAKGLGKGLMRFGGKAVTMAGGTGGTAAAVGGLGIMAASGYGGSKAGGFVSDKLFNDDSVLSKSGGALAGAAAGAGTGAAIGAGIGSLFGGVGAGPGAAIGAVTGAIFGGISGWISAGKEKKKARKAAEEILKNFGTEMDEAIKNGDIQGLKDAAANAQAKLLELQGSNKYGAKEVKKRQKEIEAEMKKAENALSNFTTFEQFFGDPDMLNKELEKQGMGVDSVKNGIINIFEVMKNGGHDVAATWSTVMGEFNQKLIDARLAMFELPLQTIEMQKKVNASQQALLEGDTSEQSVIQFLKDAYEYSLNLANGDAVKAIDHMERTLQDSYGPGGPLEKVAGVVRAQADKLKLFDPQVLTDQLIASGKIASQGRAIESISEGQISAGAAEVQIQKLLATGGAGTATQIDNLMQMYMKGFINSDQLMGGLTNNEALNAMVASGQQREKDVIAREKAREAYAAASGQPYVPTANTPSLNVGGVTVQVQGFIQDDKIAKKIATMVQEQIAKHQARSGKSQSSYIDAPARNAMR